MATFTVELRNRIVVDGELFDPGLSVQISTLQSNPLVEREKINKSFKRIHGVELLSNNYDYINSIYLNFY